MIRRACSWALAILLVVEVGPARAARNPPTMLIPPVDAVIARYFEAPSSRFGPGHRGIDYAVASGTRVRAAGDGVVSWAGTVAGNPSVTIDHGGGLESTYSILAALEVQRGEVVDEGSFIGSVGRDHEGEPGGLHFGVKLDDAYVDPLDYLGPVDVTEAIHLAPLVEDEVDDVPYELRVAHEGAGAYVRSCRDPARLEADPPPPNANIAVAIAGFSSRTSGRTNAEIYEDDNGPVGLGYAPARTYRFSYRGVGGPRFHEPYVDTESTRDINDSARRLEQLLIALHRRHPHADVDLFAHSQGGLVARALLEHLAGSYDPRLPRVDHLVTYGTPHRGTPLASVPAELEEETFTGRFLVDRLSSWARGGGGVWDPHAPAVAQMRPGSDFLVRLAREDVSFGTRVLALAMPHDLVVPADHALYPGHDGRVLSPTGLHGHDSVLTSDEARTLAYSFLRDAPDSCLGNWDEWGPTLSGAIGWAHGLIADAYAELETMGAARAFKILKWAGTRGWEVLKWGGAKAWSAVRWSGDKVARAGRLVVDAGGRAVGTVEDAGEAVGRLVRSGWAKLWGDD